MHTVQRCVPCLQLLFGIDGVLVGNMICGLHVLLNRRVHLMRHELVPPRSSIPGSAAPACNPIFMRRSAKAQSNLNLQAMNFLHPQVAIEPMLSFITKVTAVRVAAQSNAAAAKPLREQVRSLC